MNNHNIALRISQAHISSFNRGLISNFSGFEVFEINPERRGKGSTYCFEQINPKKGVRSQVDKNGVLHSLVT